ncbi:glycosyltransferase family 4 protein [Thermomonas sp. HDW16]|uniref:glycosyltransferase family 4 protein n=1 Tax=Thermomonas sp. HDW16 TaxID=2714945 RepID=UPI0014099916|nr:glycosyltransferase family 4 protein [Thermomonas sp. HDW16]QIL21432.1 glycosyltransferase family 4 protein [Thermomonas sp. HDW16]
MERLNLRLAHALADIGPLAVCGPFGCGAELPPDTSVAEVPAERLSRFLVSALPRALSLARSSKPGVVVAGSGLSAPFAWACARLFGARYIVYLHGLDIVTNSTPYRLAWLPFVRRADLALVNSRNTAMLATRAGVAHVEILHPGTDFPPLRPDAVETFRERHGLGARPLMLSVGRLTPRKGLVDFVHKTLPLVLNVYPDARLVVIGDDAVHAAKTEPGSELRRVQEAAEAAGMTGSILFLPHCDDEVLATAYQSADVHVFPVREVPGDVEGFGMVAIEAAANGLPTVAFAVGGVPDAVLEHATGDLIVAGDHEAFARAITHRLETRGDVRARRAIREAAACYGWEVFETRLRRLLDGGDP